MGDMPKDGGEKKISVAFCMSNDKIIVYNIW